MNDEAPRSRPWGRLVSIALGLGVAVLLVRAARNVPWHEVRDSVLSTSVSTIGLALALSATSYALVASFDLVGRAVVRHQLPRRTVLRVAALCYAANQNLGYLVGGIALRLRLYTGQGLNVATVAGVAATAVLTNWMGFACVLGAALVVAPPELPSGWPIGLPALRAAGGVALAAVLAYVVACFSATRRRWRWRAFDVTLPAGRLAVLQVAMGAANWLLMATIVWIVLPPGTPWPPVVTTLLLAAVAGVIAHVPAGLGVLEAVFVALLSSRVPVGALLGGLLLYRAAYQWVPGLLALAAWLLGGQDRAVPRGTHRT